MNAIVVPPAFHWPITFLSIVGFTTWVVSLITSNVSQIDRLWTFLPTIYTGYFALLPLWPDEEDVFRVWGVPLAPYVPREVQGVARNEFSLRALLMFSLVVSGPT
jgi:steroid 5-alpha reductase family enzyme